MKKSLIFNSFFIFLLNTTIPVCGMEKAGVIPKSPEFIVYNPAVDGSEQTMHIMHSNEREILCNGEDAQQNFMHAVLYGYRDLVERYMEEVNINHEDVTGRTALMFASDREDLAIATMLLKHTADPNKQTKSGKTALMFAAHKGNIPMMRELLHHDADINAKDKRGRTALFMVTTTQAMKFLLMQGADLHCPDNMGNPPLLHYIRKKHSNDLVGWVLKKRGDSSTFIQNRQGDDAEALAKKCGNMQALSLVKTHRALALSDEAIKQSTIWALPSLLILAVCPPAGALTLSLCVGTASIGKLCRSLQFYDQYPKN